MILTKYQRDFAIDKIKHIVDYQSKYYQMTNLPLSTKVKFEIEGMEFVEFYYDNSDVLTRCDLRRNNHTLSISRNQSTDFDNLDKMVKSRMRTIDDWKFSEIFPEFDVSHRRDEKLEEILPKTEVQLEDKPKKIGNRVTNALKNLF